MDSASAAGDELNAPSKPAPPQDLTSEATLLEQISDIERRIKQIETGLDKPAPIPAGIRAKVHALRKWQMQIIHKEAEFHKKAHAMEVAFQDEFNQCHGAISRLVNGLEVPEPDGGAGADAADQPSGIPEFWLAVLKASLLEGFIREADEPALKSLTDIRCVLKNEPEPSFLLEFQFASDNAYFTNEVLTKEYILRCAPDERDPASFEGFVIHRSVGCEIDWKPGHNLVEKAASESPEDDAGGSFFEFFQPEKQMREVDDPDLQYALAHNDFQQGYYIKEKIIPRAVFLFLGEYVSFHDCDNCCLWAQNDCEPMELDDEDTQREATESDAVEESKTNADE